MLNIHEEIFYKIFGMIFHETFLVWRDFSCDFCDVMWCDFSCDFSYLDKTNAIHHEIFRTIFRKIMNLWRHENIMCTSSPDLILFDIQLLIPDWFSYKKSYQNLIRFWKVYCKQQTFFRDFWYNFWYKIYRKIFVRFFSCDELYIHYTDRDLFVFW